MILVEHDGGLVTREEIQKKLWPNDTIVEFRSQHQRRHQTLRRALGDSADEPEVYRDRCAAGLSADGAGGMGVSPRATSSSSDEVSGGE